MQISGSSWAAEEFSDSAFPRLCCSLARWGGSLPKQLAMQWKPGAPVPPAALLQAAPPRLWFLVGGSHVALPSASPSRFTVPGLGGFRMSRSTVGYLSSTAAAQCEHRVPGFPIRLSPPPKSALPAACLHLSRHRISRLIPPECCLFPESKRLKGDFLFLRSLYHT